MARQHGVTTETYERLIIDAGQVRKNYVDETDPGVLLGATRGGSVFSVDTELREMPVDGAKGPVKGDKRIIKVTASLECNFIESTSEIFKRILCGSAAADFPSTGTATHDDITRSLQLQASDYLTNVVIIGEVAGSAEPVILFIENALSDGKLSMSLADNDESVNKVKFVGHFDPDDLDSEPWKIRFPQDVNPTTEGA
jgi:hypothetical protein